MSETWGSCCVAVTVVCGVFVAAIAAFLWYVDQRASIEKWKSDRVLELSISHD